MKRKATILLTVTWLMLGTLPALQSRAWAATEAATLKSVALSVSPSSTELILRVDGVYAYKTVQSGPDTLFIDLAGVKSEGVPRSQQWANPVFPGYKLLQYKDASGAPAVRVQVDTKQSNPLAIRKDGSKLCVVYDGNALSSSAAAPAYAAAPAPVAATAPEAIPARTASSAASSGLLKVSKVSLDKRDSGETFVDVYTSRTASYHVSTLPNPSRLIIDIDDAQKVFNQNSYAVDTASLKELRVGQFRAGDPSVVRVVAELTGNPAFDVHATPDGLRIELRTRGAVASMPPAPKAPVSQSQPKDILARSAEAPAPPVSKPSAPQTKPQEVLTTHVEASIPPALKAPAPPVQPKEKVVAKAATAEPAPPVLTVAAVPSTVVINRSSNVPPPLKSASTESAKTDVQSTLPTAAKVAEAAPLPPPAMVTPEVLRAEHAAQTLGGREATPSMAQAAPPASPVAPQEEAKPVYTGELISLNLKDVDLKDFFRLIHEISGLNIIIDPNVSGAVTLVLDSVPWDQALDIVLKNNRLGKVLEGNVLRIARVETLTAEQEGTTKLAAARMDASPLVTVFRPINYAKATDIAALLKTWAGGGALSRRGTVLVDARSNTLIVSDVQTQIPIIQNILTRLDKKAKQVSIEARVVLANADFTRTLSAALSGSTRTPQGSTQIGGATGTGSTAVPTNVTPNSTAPFGGLTIPATSGTGFGAIAITNASSRYLINAVITAQEERDQAKTISRPTIVTQNNVQGMVQQGTQVPIQTSINNTVSVQYYPATLELTVTPQVTDDDNVFLILNVTNNSVGASISGVGPEIATQQATTQVLVPDGGTVVFGGITVTTRSKAATYVPLLGNIPVLGHLFKTSNVQDQDQELLFFVSPKVLGG